MKLNKMMVLVSAECAGLHDDDNADRTAELRQWIGNSYRHRFSSALGKYDGNTENSFLIQVDDFRDVGYIANKAAEMNQESIMIVDARDKAFLYYPATKALEPIGIMLSCPLSAFNAEHHTSYTIIGDIAYYTI
ncbi:SAM-dependent methyltransferase [Klebsiella phage vB_Kpl_K59PH2]|uniref:SAM-dependent methyltransferase n=1 Tax=Klebsiella phage vB_Kpl_K59PH2 TaxID=3071671 RepID=A0AAD2GP48_9CAUD|nr:SAM-dependent methyltransferase [Klebsiella phage vB_Kpl_K59PH2]